MKNSNYLEVYDNPVEEARRYVANAKKTIRDNEQYDPETGCYNDPKYIRSAGHYLWHAVLIMLDAVFHVKSNQQSHPDINDYLLAIRQRDRKLLTLVHTAYTVNHITLGYDGVLKKTICNDGVHLANDIIDRCAAMLPNQTI
jgi:hypothetical protein